MSPDEISKICNGNTINDLINELNGIFEKFQDKEYVKQLKLTEKVKYISRACDIEKIIKLNESLKKQNKTREIRKEVNKNKQQLLAYCENKCYVCGLNLKEILEIHHLTPIKEGGINELNNLVSLCPTCHSIVHKYMTAIDQIKEYDNVNNLDSWCKENLSFESYNRLQNVIYAKYSSLHRKRITKDYSC